MNALLRRRCPAHSATTTVRVPCLGEWHSVSWQNDRLVLHDHSDMDMKFLKILDSHSRCGEILATISAPIRADELPWALWTARARSNRRLLNGPQARVVDHLWDQHYAIRTLDICFVVGVTFSMKAPIIEVSTWNHHSRDKNNLISKKEHLAIYCNAGWRVNWAVARELVPLSSSHVGQETFAAIALAFGVRSPEQQP
jgi:hypothetical protein